MGRKESNQTNKQNLHAIYFKMAGTYCTDDARVKVPSFQKSVFLQYEIFHRDAIHLYFCLCGDVSDCRD